MTATHMMMPTTLLGVGGQSCEAQARDITACPRPALFSPGPGSLFRCIVLAHNV